MSRTSRSSSASRPWLAVFATLLVVGGIVAAAYFSSHPANEPPPKPSSTDNQPPATSSTVAVSSSTILLVNADAVTVLKLDGTSERILRETFLSRYDISKLPSEGSEAGNGARHGLDLGDKVSGLMNSAGYVAKLGAPKSDGAAVVDVTRPGKEPVSMVVRSGKGLIKDVALLGWLDDRTLAFTGVSSSTRSAFALPLDGTPKLLAPLPDNLLYLDVRQGAIWYSTAVLGQGLEDQPKGPSELHRLDPSGQDALVAQDALRVVTGVLPYATSSCAFLTDDGQAIYLKIGEATSRLLLGKRMPLAFVSDHELLMRDGFDLVLFDLSDGKTTKLGRLPEGEVTAAFVPDLDAALKTQ